MAINMISEVVSNGVLDTAYDWLCRRRINYPEDADIWDLRFKWPGEKAGIQRDVFNNTYTFSPLSRVTNRDGESMALWSARDSLVLKAMTIVLEKHLPVSRNCTHIRAMAAKKQPSEGRIEHLHGVRDNGGYSAGPGAGRLGRFVLV